MTQYKKHQRKTCQVTWCYRVSHRKLETFKSTFFHSIIMLDQLHSKQSPVSIHLQLYENFASFHKFSQSSVSLFLSNLSFNKEKKKSSKISQCAIRTPQQAIQNIQYLFFSIKKSPHDISLKNHSLIDSTVSNVQKKFTKQFFTGHIQVFKKTIKKLYRMGSNLFHIFFFVFAINYLYEKT